MQREFHQENGTQMALFQAAIEVYDAEFAIEQAQFHASAARMRPEVRREVGRTVELRYQGHAYKLQVYRLGPHHYRIDVDGSRIDLRRDRLGKSEQRLTCAGRRFWVSSVVQGVDYLVDVDGVPHRISRNDGGIVRAPAPAVVVSITVQPGDEVTAGDRLAVLEAMKMEIPILALVSGRVREILVMNNTQVAAGAPLARIESAAEDAGAVGAERVLFNQAGLASAPSEMAESRWRRTLEELRCLMLGFDVNPADVKRLIADWNRLVHDLPSSDQEMRRGRNEILNVFADVSALFRRKVAAEGPEGIDTLSTEEYLTTYMRTLDAHGSAIPRAFCEKLQRALAHYGVRSLDRSPGLQESLLWIYKAHQRVEQQIPVVLGLLEQCMECVDVLAPATGEEFLTLLERLIAVSQGRYPAVNDLAREVRYRCFDQPLFEQARNRVYQQMEAHLTYLAHHPNAQDRSACLHALIECPQPLVSMLTRRFAETDLDVRQLMLEAITRRYYRIRNLESVRSVVLGEHVYATAEYDHEGKRVHLITTYAEESCLSRAVQAMRPLLEAIPADHDVVIDFYVHHAGPPGDAEATQQAIRTLLNQVGFPHPIRRVVAVMVADSRTHSMEDVHHFTYRFSGDEYREEKFYRGYHPMMAKRLHIWPRFKDFALERLPSAEDVYLFRGVARANPKDERLLAVVEVRDLTPVRDELGRMVRLPHLERMLNEALSAIRLFQSRRRPEERLQWNRVLLYLWPPLDFRPEEINEMAHTLAPTTEDLGLEQVVIRAQMPDPETGALCDREIRISNPGGTGFCMTFAAPSEEPIAPMTEYTQKALRMRQLGLAYPYEVIKMLTPAREGTQAEFPPGDFIEYDLNEGGQLIPVHRPYGQNKASMVVGVIRNFTPKHPEGMARVMLLGDPSRSMGALAEPECRRILAALDLASHMGVPLEWFAVSAGAKISMESGVENMDWIARVLRRIIEFTQAAGEINVVVNGVNVGAQPYWNAEATMLMHTRGILIMTPAGVMVLTGKKALDYSGSVSAEDNFGIGGYDRIMGLNGQAQYWARNLSEACHVLLRHYEHVYVAPGERFPRRACTTDPLDRDVRAYPYSSSNVGDDFTQVGDIFTDEKNPGRKKPFDVRKVMMSVIDQDHLPLERWPDWRDAETVVVWDGHLGGYPVCLIGIESRPAPRLGFVPADGPDHWTAGTLFPQSSRKAARALNAASGNRPVVILANLSGFDGSPESMRKWQLEYGAEIGRAVVNFKGPIVFCVISRYHGGAYVVFSRYLNENMQAVALEGSFASVIGGPPAAAVVFAGDVKARTQADPRIKALEEELAQASGADKARLRARLNDLFNAVYSEKLGEVADEFGKVHSVHRARTVGALDQIIAAAELRPYLIEAVERGMRREIERIKRVEQTPVPGISALIG